MAEKQENSGTMLDEVNENLDTTWNSLVLAHIILFPGNNEKEDDC